MCGIAGIVGSGAEKTGFRLQSMLESIDHRGPDDSGVFIQNEIAIGHKRLSILDQSKAGHNPFFSNDSKYVIVYNGEVYNYLELRKELKDKYSFKTNTDTEVVLAAYIVWGSNCVEKFIGMFSFVIWDSVNHQVFGSRDRFGIKPFFYSFSEGLFFFSSEIKSLLSAKIPKKPNFSIINEYLQYGLYDHCSESFFDGIYKLLPGNSFILKKGKLRVYQYWNLEDFESDENYTESYIEDTVMDILSESVNIALRSDVNIGVNLSGGLDSSCLLNLINNNWDNDYNLSCFTQDYKDQRFSERFWVEQIAKDNDKSVYFSQMSPQDFKNVNERLMWYQDEPYAGVPVAGYIGMYQQTKRQDVTVLLDGNGMDEAFGGYKQHNISFLKDLKNNNDKDFQIYMEAYLSEWGGSKEQLLPLLNQKQQGAIKSRDGTTGIHPNLLAKDFTKKFSNGPTKPRAKLRSNLKNEMFQDATFSKIPRALRFNDRVSMAFSKELRVPFLDHRLFEFTFSLNNKLLYSQKRPKGIIRKIFSKHLPADIINASKRSIQTPQSEWLNNDLRPWVDDILNSKSFKDCGIFDVEKTRSHYSELKGKELNNSFYIWQIVNLELWFRQNFGQTQNPSEFSRFPKFKQDVFNKKNKERLI
jgi:asparagine synthase (glutamine-hydrolysing)